MALVSPGIQISINDQSQYVSNAVGSVPLVLLATAQDKTYNGSLASGTTKANAGKLQSFTSQRDLVTAMGVPVFQTSAAGTPDHGGSRNEYGLMAAYSALGLGNQLYAIRADIDLDQLTGTSVRPFGDPANNQHWLDLTNTSWGIYEKNDSGFDGITETSPTAGPLLIITDKNQVEADTGNYPGYPSPGVAKPKTSVGNIGSYALVMAETDGSVVNFIRLWKKTGSDAFKLVGGPGQNQWVEVGSPAWQLSVPATVGTGAPVYTVGDSFEITTPQAGVTTVTTTGTASITNLVTDINDAEIPGVYADAVNGALALYVTADAGSPPNQEAKITIGNFSGSQFGLTSGDYYAPNLFYGNYAQRPTGGWGFASNEYNRPNGSIWWKTGATGAGMNIVLKKYNSSTSTWDTVPVPVYNYGSDAVYGLDPTGGGVNIIHGQVVLLLAPTDGSYNGIRLQEQVPDVSPTDKRTIAIGGTFTGTTPGDTFEISASSPMTAEMSIPVSITVGTTAADFVSALLFAGLAYVTAEVTSDGRVSIIHQTGGQIHIRELSGTPMADAGFLVDSDGSATGNGSGYTRSRVFADQYYINKWSHTEIMHGTEIKYSAPYAAPADGTYWYYSNPTEVDVMINMGPGNGWKNYKHSGTDTRGYLLDNTDSNGVIISASEPLAQTDGSALVSGDLWLDTGDLVNYPALYRYDSVTTIWTKIDNSDHITSNGIIFADARWDTDGTTDVISDNLPLITDLLGSDYTDLDCPDSGLYPTGILLFNTRRSGYNVKKFVKDYYNETSFPDDTLPTARDAWVSVSGLYANGSMKAGLEAQRSLIVESLKSAIDSNFEIREDRYQFNLLCAPGYPELISNLVTLNTDRGETGFIVGETPMTLEPTATSITEWNNNTTGDGLSIASPYLGIYYPAGLTSDLSGNPVAVPASHMALRTFLYNDNVSYSWFAPAGTHRGLVSNVNDIGYVNKSTGSWVHNSINQGLRDSLYTQAINPITQLPGVGIVVWGQETKSGTSSSRNRINVVRLENYLRTVFKTIANGYLFEPNDQATRKSIASQIESALNDVLGKRGIYDFLVVCDTTNNTPSAIANNQLFVDVAIEPARDVEFIYIPIALYNPGSLASLGTSST